MIWKAFYALNTHFMKDKNKFNIISIFISI